MNSKEEAKIELLKLMSFVIERQKWYLSLSSKNLINSSKYANLSSLLYPLASLATMKIPPKINIVTYSMHIPINPYSIILFKFYLLKSDALVVFWSVSDE